MAVSQGRLQQQHVRIFKTECIGQGSFGIVYKAQCNLLACAAKIIRPDLFDKTDSSREELLEKVASGFALLNQFQHPNIIQCLGTDQDDVLGLPVLLMEFIEENLTSFLQHNPLLSNHLHVQVDIVSDVSLALYYLHSNGIIHGNLSSNNVFVCPSHRAKVSDIKMLDLPVSTTASDGPGSPVSTNSYKPTEAFGDSEVECEKLDCFSVGVVSVQVITGRFPDPSPKLQRVKSYAGMVEVSVPEVDRRQSHISLIDDTHPLLPILTECLKDKKTERPSSHDLCTRLASLKEHDEYRKSRDFCTHELQPGDHMDDEFSVDVDMNEATHGIRLNRSLTVVEYEDVGDSADGLPEKGHVLAELNCENRDRRGIDLHEEEGDPQSKTLSRALKETTAALVEREAQLERVKRERFELSVSLQHLQKEMLAMKKKNERLEQDMASKERELQRLQRGSVSADAKNGTQSHGTVTMTWRRSSDAPFSGKLGSATALGDLVCIRVAGSSEIHVCDTSNQEWFLTPPCPLDACSLVSVKNTLTVVGGRIDASVTNHLYSIHLKSFQAVKKQPWREQFPAMLTKRMFAMAVSSGNVLVVAGGWNGHQALRTVEILRLDHYPMHWSRVSSLPSPVYSASACICKGKLYVLGGFTQKGPTKAVLSATVHSLLDSTKDNVWHRPTSLPTFRSTCVTFNDHLLCFGGENDNELHHLYKSPSAANDSRETDAVYEYSSTEGEWCMISEMPVPRCQSCVAVLTERREIMVVGGHTGPTGRTQTVQVAALEQTT